MNESYFLYYGGEKRGPFALDQLKSMWASGSVAADAVYRLENEEEWKPLADFMSVPPAATPAAPPPPAPEKAPEKVIQKKSIVELVAEKAVQKAAADKAARDKAAQERAAQEKAAQAKAAPEKTAPEKSASAKAAPDKPANRPFSKPAAGVQAPPEPIFFKRPKPTAAQLAQQQAWLRFCARVADNIIVEVLFFAVLLLVARGFLFNLFSHGWVFASLVLWLPVVTLLMLWDCWFLPKHGATPGKRMFGITVAKEGGGMLSRSEAGSRFLGLVFYVFIPFVQLVTLYLVFGRLKSEGVTPWDKAGGYVVKDGGDIRWLQVVGVAALWAVLMPWFMGKVSHPPVAQRQPVTPPVVEKTPEPVSSPWPDVPAATPLSSRPSPTASATEPMVLRAIPVTSLATPAATATASATPRATPTATATMPARTPVISLPSATAFATPRATPPATASATPNVTLIAPSATPVAKPVAKPATADFSETVKVEESDAGFAYDLPQDWFVQQVPGWKTRTAFGAIHDDTPCNIAYRVLESRRPLDDEEAALLKKARQNADAGGFTDVEIIAAPQKFESASGAAAAKFIMNSVRQDGKSVRQTSYLFERKDHRKVEMTCTSVERGDKYDDVFDAIMKTFRITK